MRAFTGARAVRVVHPPGQVIAEHRHDWPVITIPSLGGYDEHVEDSEVGIAGPAAVLHPAGQCHANCIHNSGMETISIEFDARWLRTDGPPIRYDRSRWWMGGAVTLSARRLARIWSNPTSSEAQVRQATATFLHQALASEQAENPSWFNQVRQMLDLPLPPSTLAIARQLDMHPAWLARAYRQAAGEGLQSTVRRKRVERALGVLRCSDEPIAEIAAAVGFCDQSHLNRAVREVTGRTPMQLRNERVPLAQIHSSSNRLGSHTLMDSVSRARADGS